MKIQPTQLTVIDLILWRMSMSSSEDIGKLVLRVTLAVLMLFHGVDKIGNLSAVIGIIGKRGLPEFLAYSIYISEIIAPLMLLIGFRIKIAALIMSSTIFVASLLVFANKFFTLGEHGAYALEVQAFYMAVGIAIFFLGNDRYCLDVYRRK